MTPRFTYSNDSDQTKILSAKTLQADYENKDKAKDICMSRLNYGLVSFDKMQPRRIG
jgi:hypothetical protein